MIYHPCYSIILKYKKIKVLYLWSKKKCRKIIQNENIKYICDPFPFVKGNTDMAVHRAEVTFLISKEEMNFFFSIILCFIIGYRVISVSKGSNK